MYKAWTRTQSPVKVLRNSAPRLSCSRLGSELQENPRVKVDRAFWSEGSRKGPEFFF